MAITVKQDIVGLDVSVHNSPCMNIQQRTGELSHPKSDGVFGKRLARDVESEVPAIHQIDYQVSALPVSDWSIPPCKPQHTSIRYPGSCIADCTETGG